MNRRAAATLTAAAVLTGTAAAAVVVPALADGGALSPEQSAVLDAPQVATATAEATPTATAEATPAPTFTADPNRDAQPHTDPPIAWDQRNQSGQVWADYMMREYMMPRGWQTIDQWRDDYPAGDERGDVVDYTATEPGHLVLTVDTENPTHADLFTQAHVIVGAIGYSRPAEFETTTVRTDDGAHSATFTCSEIPGCKTEPWPEY